MKNRIIALVLVLVMSVLALASCGGSFDLAEEDLSAYATFDYETFKTKLQSIEIEDGDYTTDPAIREKKFKEAVYGAVSSGILSATFDSDKLTEGAVGENDVLYFVYYAVDKATGNVFFTSQMQESSITEDNSKANHVIKLGGVDLEDEDADEFMKLIKENLKKDDIKDLVYSMLTADGITEKAEADAKAENADAAETEIDAAVKKALKVKAGDTVVISYTRSYTKVTTDGEGNETSSIVNETAAYETVVLSEENGFHKQLLHEKSTANVGEAVKVFDMVDEDGMDVLKSEFKATVDGVTYTYKDVKILWQVEKAGAPIAEFTYKPYDSAKSVTPDNAYTSNKTVDLKDVELTYYVYPVNYVKIPSHEEIDATDVLTYVYGSNLTQTSFEIFEDEGFVSEGEKLPALVEKVADIFDTKSTDNEYYKDGTELKALLTKYNNAVTAGGSNPDAAKQALIDKNKEALTKEQNKELAKVVAAIVSAKNGEQVAGEKILEEYFEDKKHSLKEEYDSDITEKVQAEVWKLIDEMVTVTGYPEKLVEEFYKHLYDGYEYQYYNGTDSTSNKVPYFEKYDSIEAYIRSSDCLNVSESKNADLKAVITEEAKTYAEPIIKIYVVAKACEADAKAALPGYIEADIASGAYEVDAHSIEEVYGTDADKLAKKLAEAEKNAKESIEEARRDADKFLIDDAYMKAYKKDIGKAYYRQLLEEYGEINLRASMQFNRLFYYLTSTNLVKSEGGGHNHSEVKYTEDGTKLDFRTVSYTIVTASDTEEDDHDHE